MWSTLTWQGLRDPEIANDVDTLREEALWFLVWTTAAGYLAWHTVATVQAPAEDRITYWCLFLIVMAGVGITYTLQRRKPRLAGTWFLLSSVVSITAAIWLLGAPMAALFYPLVAVAAIVLLHPLAGLLVVFGSLGVLSGLWIAGPLAFVGADRLIETIVASLLTIVVAWALGRNMVIAVEWSLHNYRQARLNAQEAQIHRAKSVGALKQLDNAYYRLQQANAALVMAWKAAENAERSKSEFVTNISHELRTPLNLIAGFSEMVLTSPESYGEPLPASYRRDLNAIYRSAQHLLTLANDVIDLARVGIGRLALAREPVNLEQIIGDACAIVQDYITAKGLWLRVEMQPGLPLLNVDRLRIRQVLLNLLTNAARFTEHGGITIVANAEATGILVKVIDTGHGIALDDLPRVFEEFHHDGEDAARLPAGLGGIGLGLPISKRFVELHGGQMGVESSVGTGTTFWFSLPASATTNSIANEIWQPIRPVGATGAQERVIVLAGADGRHTQFLQRHLRGYRVLAAPDLNDAFAIARELHAVAVLVDPDASELGDYHDVPVPVLRVPLPLGERMATVLGVTDYLAKPVTRGELSAAVERVDQPIRSVLIVDDDPHFVQLLTRILQTQLALPVDSIVSAHTGREALDRMETIRPDLVLLDLVMPEQGGRSVLAAMRANPHLAGVPIIVISAQDEIDGQLTLQGPLAVERSEGFRIEELLGAIESLLGTLDPPRRFFDGPVAKAGATGE